MKNDFEKAKENILKELMERVKESKIDFLKVNEYDFRRSAEGLFKSILKENKISFNIHEQEEILGEMVSYLLGLGPIDKLLSDPEISDIMINGPKQIYVERKGNLELTDASFRDNEHLFYLIEQIVSPLGRRATEFEPYVDARLKDGSRVNIVSTPVSGIGPVLTIRKYSHHIFSIDDLIGLGTLDSLAAEFLKACVVSRVNILVCGGAGSGKTTLLNVLASFIPPQERIITIEDTLELNLPGKHVVPLESRPPNIEGKGEITIRDLLRNSLHMRPNRIIVGEVRSSEVLDMIQAMNTGHDGSMTTLHANSPLDALERLEVLLLMGSPNISSEVAKRQILSALDLLVHMERLTDGSRKIIRISAMGKSKETLLEDIFIFKEEDKVMKCTGKAPLFYPKLKRRANYICQEFEQGS